MLIDNVADDDDDDDMLLQVIMMMTSVEDLDYDVCEDDIAMMEVKRTFSSEHEYEIENECNFQILNQSQPQNSRSFPLFTRR